MVPRNVGTPHELKAPLPCLYQKYAGHDNNRDWPVLNLRETRNVTRLLYRSGFRTSSTTSTSSRHFPRGFRSSV
jgi:hypothetical protein